MHLQLIFHGKPVTPLENIFHFMTKDFYNFEDSNPQWKYTNIQILLKIKIFSNFRDQFRALLQHNFQRHYGTNRAPLSLSFDPAWLISNKGFDDVLNDWMANVLVTYPDVYFTTEIQVMEGILISIQGFFLRVF